MPLSELQWDDHLLNNPLLQEQMAYNVFDLLIQVQQNKDHFNDEQCTVYDAIMQSILHKEGKTFFLHSAGKGGKYLSATLWQQVFGPIKLLLLLHLLLLLLLTWMVVEQPISVSRFQFPFMNLPLAEFQSKVNLQRF
jgi:hypothetical protein